MASWSEMLEEIMYRVAKHLPPDVEEFARFSCISKSWRSSAITLKQHNIIQCAPWLLLTKRENDNLVNNNNEEGIRSFYSISSKRVFDIKLPTQGRRCWGTPYSWIFTMGLNRNINLLNPFSRVQISLPSQSTFEHQYRIHREPQPLCENFIHKIALASNPSSWNSNASPSTTAPTVMVSYGEFSYLAMAIPGDKAWTSVEGYFAINITDVNFYNGHIYVVYHCGEVGMCDIATTPPTAIKIASPPDGAVANMPHRYYLIEMCGDLYLIGRVSRCGYSEDEETEDGEEEEEESEPEHGDEEEEKGELEVESDDENEEDTESKHRDETELGEETEPEDEEDYDTVTKFFLVFKFDFHAKAWSEVKDLGDYVVFVGKNQSFATSSARYSEFSGNSIYFTDDHDDFYNSSYCDMGIYDMSKRTVEPINISAGKLSKFSRPVFFMPTP